MDLIHTADITGAATESAACLRGRVDREFRAFIQNPRFSCLAGKGAVQSGGYTLRVYSSLGAVDSTGPLARDLAAFIASIGASSSAGPSLRTFVAVFPEQPPASEAEFERRLWDQLQRLHDCEPAGTDWDPAVSSDPADPRFAFSFAGRALFVVGMHAASSRLARRFCWPALVFNPHAQFEELRASGKFERLRTMVRDREIAVQGSLNPNLADFGEQSDARQYSGRPAEPDWQCPFHLRAE